MTFSKSFIATHFNCICNANAVLNDSTGICEGKNEENECDCGVGTCLYNYEKTFAICDCDDTMIEDIYGKCIFASSTTTVPTTENDTTPTTSTVSPIPSWVDKKIVT